MVPAILTRTKSRFEVILNARRKSSLLITCFALSLCWFANSFAQEAVILSAYEQYGIAAGHYERQEFEVAAEKFRNLIESAPSTRQAAISHFFLGESLVQVQDFKAAYPAYQIYLKRLPSDANAKKAQFRMAECAFRLNWDTQAVNQLEKFVEKFPNDVLNEYALTYLGETRLRRQEPQLAMHVLDRALVEYPHSQFAPQNRFAIARSLQEMGRTDEAVRFYTLLTNSNTNPFFGKANLQVGKIAFQESRLSDAQKRLSLAAESLVDETAHAEAKLWLGKTEMALNDFDSAFQHLTEASGLTDRDDLQASILFDGAVAASKSGHPERALDWADRIQQTWPKSLWADDALQLRIELLYRQQRYDEALAAIKTFAGQFDDHDNLPTVLEYQGRIFYDQGLHEESLDVFDGLIRRFAKDSARNAEVDSWLYMKGLSQIGLKKFQAAAETFAVVDLFEKEQSFVASVLLAQASSSVGMEMPERAVEYLQDYLETSPTGSSADRARSDLAIAYAQSNNWDLARSTLQEFGANFSDDKTYLDTKLLVAELALKEKRFDLSEQWFVELTNDRNPRAFIVRALSGLAWVRMERGDELSSVAVFERLVREYGDSEFAAEAAMACGKHFEKKDQYDNAIEMYRHVNSKFKHTSFAPLAKLRHAYSLYKQGGNSNLLTAESMLLSYQNNESLFLDEAAYQLAWIYHETNRNDKAIELFAQIVDQYENSKYWDDSAYRIAQNALSEDDMDKVNHLSTKLANRDVSKEIRQRIAFLQGQSAVKKGNWVEVRKSMAAVLQDSDDETLRKKARYWLAESEYNLDHFNDAAEQLDRLIGNPELIDAKRSSWVRLRRAQCFAHAENWTDALEMSLTAKNEFKKFEAMYEFDYVIGRSHAAQGRLTEARKSYRSVIESRNGKATETAAMAQWRIGETYFHQEDYENAIEAFYRVDSLYAYTKWRAAALVEAGKCQEHLGNWTHATKLYRQLIDKFPESEFRQVAESRLNLATRQATKTDDKTTK